MLSQQVAQSVSAPLSLFLELRINSARQPISVVAITASLIEKPMGQSITRHLGRRTVVPIFQRCHAPVWGRGKSINRDLPQPMSSAVIFHLSAFRDL